ncbi:T9SS type A sorting domain-containing protein [Changchengzhania lutea]|uniref:T9SS type A sorting domain-containing protein n=1 Tax=Changchengzhania lutea TaxID=2049305 RepID=UPI00115F549B|nr:T9SS type A sorting domain-containing protein [Changchengzhania lutea]
MKKTTLAYTLMLLLFCVTGSQKLFSQSLIEIPIDKQIYNSNLIVEGKVVSQKSYWNAEKNNIYTSNTVEVYKVFKGNPVEFVEIITVGGVVGLRAQITTHSLQLTPSSQGMFILKQVGSDRIQSEGSISNSFETYSDSQGFYKYDVISNSVHNVFTSFKDIEKDFYPKVQDITKKTVLKIKNNDNLARYKSSQNKSFKPVGISNISPTSIVAGEEKQLTISGSDFGNTKGKVSFRDADDGGASFIEALDSQVLSWNNTTIVVEVPSRAGTGEVRVIHATDATFDDSSQILTVTHSEINVIDGGIAYPTQHVNENGSGGYTWQMFTDFDANTDAKNAFNRALDTWRCETKINWFVGAVTSVDAVGSTTDGANVVRFDNGTELPDGTLGRCTYFISGCGTSPNINWFVSELDIVFDDGTNWYFGEGATPFVQYDFQSVALHELGHGHQLAHVIDNSAIIDNGNDVMHFNLQNGEFQRVLSSGNLAGGNSLMDRSTTQVPCSGTSVMTESTTCNLSVEEKQLEQAINMYPNPASGIIYIENSSSILLEKVMIYDISGRFISQFDIANGARTKSINLESVSAGLYFVNIHSNAAMITKKLIVK